MSTPSGWLIARTHGNTSHENCRDSDVEPTLAHPLDDGRIAVREEAARPGLERRDARHVRVVELEVEDVEVLRHPLLAHRLGQGHDAALNEPAQHDLSDRLTMLAADARENFVVEEVVAALGEWRPSFGLHAVVAHERHGSRPAGETGSLPPGSPPVPSR